MVAKDISLRGEIDAAAIVSDGQEFTVKNLETAICCGDVIVGAYAAGGRPYSRDVLEKYDAVLSPRYATF